MKFVKWLITLIVGIVLGITITVGGVVGGFIYLNSQKISKIESLLKKDFGFAEEIRNLTLQQYYMGVYSSLIEIAKTGTGTIGDLEKALGKDIISDNISNMLGLSPEVIKSSTLQNLPNALMENLTVATISDNFGVTFPDMPIFKDEEFRNKPIKVAFESFDDFQLKDLVTIVTDEDVANDPTLIASNKVLQKLAGESIGNISTSFDKIIGETPMAELVNVGDSHIWKYLGSATINNIGNSIDNLQVKDVFEITITSSAVLKKMTVAPENASPEEKALYGTEEIKISELSSKLDSTTKELRIKDIINIDENTTPLLISLQDVKIGELSSSIDNLYLKDVVKIETDSSNPNYNALLFKLKDVAIKSFSDDVKNILDSCYLEDILKVDESSPPMLKALKGVPLNLLSTKINSLTMKDVITIDANSAFMLVALADTKVNELGTAINTLTIDKLFDVSKDGTHKIFKSLALLDSPKITLANMSEGLNRLALNEIIEIDETSHPLLLKLGVFNLSTLGANIGDAVNSLTLFEIMGAKPTTGVFALLSDEEYKSLTMTTAKDTLNTKLQTSTIGELQDSEVILTNIANTNPIYNMTLSAVIEAFARLQLNP